MNLSLRRHVLGVFALLLIAAAIYLLLTYDGGESDMAASICLRAGLTLGAIWLALPQLMALSVRFSPRILLAFLAGLVIVIARPKLFPFAVAFIAAVSALEYVGRLLKPAPKKPKQEPPERN